MCKNSKSISELRKYAKRKQKLKDWACGIIGLLLAMFLFYHLYRWVRNGVSYVYHEYILDDRHDQYNDRTKLGDHLYFFENGEHGYIRNTAPHEGKKILKDVTWVSGVERNDSLVCFASGRYRGFFNRRRGEVAIPADKYRKAWVFSDGLAAVVDDSYTVKFINPHGDVVIDKNFHYEPISASYGYLFRNGQCPMTDKDGQWGLIDMKGEWVVAPAYDEIRPADDTRWIVMKNKREGLLNEKMKIVVKPIERSVITTDFGIEVLKEDYTRQLLDDEGNVIRDFLYTDIDDLKYKVKLSEDDEDEYMWVLSPYKVYQTTHFFDDVERVGLLTPDGKPLTPPLFSSISAVNEHLFQCYYGSNASVLIDTNGRVVEGRPVNP